MNSIRQSGPKTSQTNNIHAEKKAKVLSTPAKQRQTNRPWHYLSDQQYVWVAVFDRNTDCAPVKSSILHTFLPIGCTIATLKHTNRTRLGM